MLISRRSGHDGRGPRGAIAAALAIATALAWAVAPAEAMPSSGAPKLPPGSISTVAGGVGGPGPATSVSLYFPFTCSIAQFAAGNLYIADWAGAVRVVNGRTGLLRTPAGVGLQMFSADGTLATKAGLNLPCAATVDSAGDLVIADFGDGRVRFVPARSGTFFGQKMTAGDIYTVASGGKGCPFGSNSGTFCPEDVAVDHSGNLVVSNEGSQDPHISGPFQIVVIAARSGTFYGRKMKVGGSYVIASMGGAQVAVDRAGNLVIASSTPSRVGVLAEKTGRFYDRNMKAGHFYNVAGNGIQGYSGDGGPALKAKLNGPAGVAVDRAGNLVIGDTQNRRVRVVAATAGRFYGRNMRAGDIYTVAGHRFGLSGNGVPAVRARLNGPAAVAVDNFGNLVLSDCCALVRVVAARSGRFYGKRMKKGDIYTVAGISGSAFPADGGPATSAQLPGVGVAVDATGNLLLAGERLLVVARRSGTLYGRTMKAGDIYSIAGGGTHGLGDGGPARNAELAAEQVAADGTGNLVVTDSGNNRVRVVAVKTGSFYGQPMTAGDIYTVAGNGTGAYSGDGGPATSAELNGPAGLAVDSAGNVVLADNGNNRVRVVAVRTGTFYGQPMTAGDIYTVAGNGTGGFSGDGGPATSAELQPRGVAIDGAGNLVLSDPENSWVRVVAVHTGTFYGQHMTAGDIYAVAGNGVNGFSGNGGPALGAQLNFPWGVAVDRAGNLVVGDSGNNRVRVVAVTTGTFYGQPMTAGHIYAVAGNGKFGFSGDGGPGAKAELIGPGWVAVDAAGNIFAADSGNNRIRVVSG